MFKSDSPARNPGRNLLLTFLGCQLLCGSVLAAEPAIPPEGLTLDEVRHRVLTYNEAVQIRLLEAEISRKGYLAERGIFEPQIVGSVERIDSQRPNNTQQLLSQGFSATPLLIERNWLYNGGLEFLLPTGGRLRTGYTLRRLDNNLQTARSPEYETFLGTSLTQPLLKNAGVAVTMARIRLAALASDISFQDYRRQLMLIVSQAESAYWDLYLSQEQQRISHESVTLAMKILGDNRARSEVGKSSELEVLQAQAGVALRESRQNEARLKVYEGGNRLNSFYADTTIETNANVLVLDQPEIQPISLAYYENYQQAFSLNPDYLIRMKQVEQEKLRVRYAKNQRLPQVDLRGSFGANGLGGSGGESWDDVENTDFPAWSVGLEMRIPVTGGIKERREYEAAQLSKKKALIGLKEVETQIANSLDSAIHRVQTYRDNVQSYQSVVDFHQNLLEAQLARLNVGSIDSRTVLETEEKLFEARIAVVESLVLYRKALLELELVRGSTLRSRSLDVTKLQLQSKTASLLQERNWSDSMLEEAQRRSMQSLQPDPTLQERAVEALRDRRSRGEFNTDPTPTPTPNEDNELQKKAIEALRQSMREMKNNPAPQNP